MQIAKGFEGLRIRIILVVYVHLRYGKDHQPFEPKFEDGCALYVH